MDETPGGSSSQDVERELRTHALATAERPDAEEEASDHGDRPTQVPPAAPPLRRRANGRIVAGVAGGLADRWALPAWLIRAPFAAAAFIVGVLVWNAFDPGRYGGVFGVEPRLAGPALLLTGAYAAMWWLVPREDVGVSPARRGLHRFGISPVRRAAGRYPGLRSWPGLVLLAIGGALLADQLGIWNTNVAIAFGLIALGLTLYRREPAAAAEHVARPETSTGIPSGPHPAEPSAIALERGRRERSPFGWVVFGVALLVMCVAALILQARGGSTSGELTMLDRLASVPALGLLVVGVGLLVASVFGRARWLVLPAILLVPPMLITSVVELPLVGRYGDVEVYVRELAEVDGSYGTAVGRVYLDLSKFDRREDVRGLPIAASAVLGSVTVVVPFDASYIVTGRVGLGEISLGPPTGGTEVDATETLRVDSRYAGGPSFVLDLEAGIGNVTIYRMSPTKRQLRGLEKEAAR